MKKFLCIVAALCAAVPAFAQEKTPAKAKKDKAAAVQAKAPAAETPAAEQAPNPLTAEYALGRLMQWDKRLETLQCNFTQEVLFGDTGMKQTITGRVHFLKPSHLRVEHIKPQRQIVYTDKKNIWIYKPEDSQAIRTKWEDWIKQQSTTFYGIADIGGYEKIAKNHKVSLSEPDGKNYVELAFTPKDKEQYILTLQLSKTDFFPMGIKFTVGRTEVTTTLEQVERNGKIPAELFNFVPPKGVQVMEL